MRDEEDGPLIPKTLDPSLDAARVQEKLQSYSREVARYRHKKKAAEAEASRLRVEIEKFRDRADQAERHFSEAIELSRKLLDACDDIERPSPDLRRRLDRQTGR